MATTYTQATRSMEVTTPLGPDTLLLRGFSGSEAVSQLFHFQLDLLAENGKAIPFDKLLGQTVVVSLLVDAGKKRYFSGIISRFREGMPGEDFTRYRAEVVPQLWLLTQCVQSR